MFRVGALRTIGEPHKAKVVPAGMILQVIYMALRVARSSVAVSTVADNGCTVSSTKLMCSTTPVLSHRFCASYLSREKSMCMVSIWAVKEAL